jgi:uncharacterized glyoxalase superfamily protein PhnB
VPLTAEDYPEVHLIRRRPSIIVCVETAGFSLPTRDAVDVTCAELVCAGYAGRQPPYNAFWGARYAIVTDPDGNHIGLMGPADEKRKT